MCFSKNLNGVMHSCGVECYAEKGLVPEKCVIFVIFACFANPVSFLGNNVVLLQSVVYVHSMCKVSFE